MAYEMQHGIRGYYDHYPDDFDFEALDEDVDDKAIPSTVDLDERIELAPQAEIPEG